MIYEWFPNPADETVNAPTRFQLLVSNDLFSIFRPQDKGLANDVVAISNFSSMFILWLFC